MKPDIQLVITVMRETLSFTRHECVWLSSGRLYIQALLTSAPHGGQCKLLDQTALPSLKKEPTKPIEYVAGLVPKEVIRFGREKNSSCPLPEI
jgi:hypothetical protein